MIEHRENNLRLLYGVKQFEPLAHPIENGKEHVEMLRFERRWIRITSVWWRVKMRSWSN